MVKGKNDGTYLKLKERLNRLIAQTIVMGNEIVKPSQDKNIVDLILDIGLDKAMINFR
jgi:hypothetical protein